MRAVEAHQRVHAEMPVEGRAIGFRQSLGLAPDHAAAAPLKVANAQCGEIGRDDAGQFFEFGVDKADAGGALFGEHPQRAHASAQLASG
jgi:hypothetical protein